MFALFYFIFVASAYRKCSFRSYYSMLKNICVFDFVVVVYRRKFINDGNFPIYGILIIRILKLLRQWLPCPLQSLCSLIKVGIQAPTNKSCWYLIPESVTSLILMSVSGSAESIFISYKLWHDSIIHHHYIINLI